ncbi:MAG: FkbM family methyltransferase [Bacteroidetes bacterium]|nr:MAG: FkbM family methyltransferase [Bacteroidota bacterium]
MLGKYNILKQNVANWPAYFFLKWFNKNGTGTFRLRQSGAVLQVPSAMLSVFKEVFMRNGYDDHFLKAQLPAKAVVLDVGGNIGMFAANVVNMQPQVQVHCFEPLPNNLAVLQRNATACAAFKAAITVVPSALTGVPGTHISFYKNNNEPLSQSASTIPGFLNNNDCITVPSVQLSAYVANQGFTSVDLLKLDCEGSEYDILYNTSPQVLALVRAIIVETHFVDAETKNFEALQAFLETAGFTIVKTHVVDEGMHLIWATRVQQSKAGS